MSLTNELHYVWLTHSDIAHKQKSNVLHYTTLYATNIPRNNLTNTQ